jgi:flagellar FliL protein
MTTPAASPSPAPPAPKKKGKAVIVFAVVGVLLLGGGAGAYWMNRRGAAPVEAGAAPSAATAASEAARGVLSFDPFLVNLTDGGGTRFLRLNVRLLVDAEVAERVSKNEVTMARTRSAILELLSEQSSEPLITAAGKAELKKAILERADSVLVPAKVADVLFSDFVVQF